PISAMGAESDASELDLRVERFLDSRKGTWRDLNVPEVDGRTLRDLIVKNGFKNALEIGTSTGHSAIWIAWGLSKTGGKLTTIERKSTRLNSSHVKISYAVFCLK